MPRFVRTLRGRRCLLVLLAGAAMTLPAGAAIASPISPASVGVNVIGSPPDLATASAAGLGVAREEVIQGTAAGPAIRLAAAAGMRLYPMLGLKQSNGAVADAKAMASYVTSFAQIYGPGGTYWTTHVNVPYLPVKSFEIGNEPDITPTNPFDQTSLHYANPGDYALVYEAARTALHAVDPTGVAVVGGLLDSGSISLADAESYLSAIGPMDAVGFHPYLYNTTLMEQDTLALRQWLDAHGHAGVPIDVNEFGAASGMPPDIASWGQDVAAYTQWVLCTPALHVEEVSPEWWGGTPGTDADPWYAMATSELTETPVGTAYLGETEALTTAGCPAPAPAPSPSPAQSPSPAPPVSRAVTGAPTTTAPAQPSTAAGQSAPAVKSGTTQGGARPAAAASATQRSSHPGSKGIHRRKARRRRHRARRGHS